MTAASPIGPLVTRNESWPRHRKHIRFSPHSGVAKVGCGFSAGAVEAQFDYAGADLAGTVAAGVAGDFEFGSEGVEAALGGALADVELGGDLGAGGGAAGEGGPGGGGGEHGGGGGR